MKSITFLQYDCIIQRNYDGKSYICETCHKHFHKNEIPCQGVCNKMALNPMPEELKSFKKLEKVLIPWRTYNAWKRRIF